MKQPGALDWEWLLVIVPGGVAIFFLVQMWRVIRSEEFWRDVQRLREQRERARAARRGER